MAPETREWSVPAPVRTLLWWPAISFVLVVVDPEAATGAIVGAGLVLALLGGLLAAAARRLTRRQEAQVAQDATMEIPRAEIPRAEIPLAEIPLAGRSIEGELPTTRIPRVPSQRDAAA